MEMNNNDVQFEEFWFHLILFSQIGITNARRIHSLNVCPVIESS